MKRITRINVQLPSEKILMNGCLSNKKCIAK